MADTTKPLTLTQLTVLELYRMRLTEGECLRYRGRSTSGHHCVKRQLSERGLLSVGDPKIARSVKALVHPRSVTVKNTKNGAMADLFHEADLSNHTFLHWKQWNNRTLPAFARTHVRTFQQNVKDVVEWHKNRYAYATRAEIEETSRVIDTHGISSPEYAELMEKSRAKVDARMAVLRPLIAWDNLPILADALEEADCQDRTILGILRSDAPPHADRYGIIPSVGPSPTIVLTPRLQEMRAAGQWAALGADPEYTQAARDQNVAYKLWSTAHARGLMARYSYDWTVYRLCQRLAL